ncbi:MAG TPA: DUF3426 domain-containing protein [Thermodesulfobacteriota bacterium]|nr:DUF3426 domain-containing protein [Thermodesulfobacteriota bacterium]
MIITCASCLTKFNLDDSRIQAKGIKVRCSRCKHIFYVVPPPETKQEMIENAESFAKYHEDLMEPAERKEEAPAPEPKAQKQRPVDAESFAEYHADLVEPGERKEEAPLEPRVQKQRPVPEEEEEPAFLTSEKAPVEDSEPLTFPEKVEEPAAPEIGEEFSFEEPKGVEREEIKPARPKGMLRAEKRGPLRFLPLMIVLVLLILGFFYVWSELSSGGRLASYLDYSMKRMNDLWSQLWGVEKEDLSVGDLGRYDEQIEGIPLSIIEGKVKNQSKFTKKYIKVRITIFDEDKAKVAEQDAICGRIISREELKNQPPEFFQGDMMIKPQTEQEMVVPTGKTVPFMVILKDLSSRAKDFKYEIVEAPNL